MRRGDRRMAIRMTLWAFGSRPARARMRSATFGADMIADSGKQRGSACDIAPILNCRVKYHACFGSS